MSRKTPAPVSLELAAACLVPAAAIGFVRVFVDGGSITPIIGASLLSTAVAVLLRRLRVPLAVSALLSAFFLLALMVNRFAPGTAQLGVFPTGATRDQFQLLIDELVLNFQELKTPVPALEPFVAAAMVGAWLMAFLTDWGALRLRLAFEPVLPAGLLFVFTAVLGAGSRQITTTVVFATAIAVWAVVQRAVNLADGNAWLANDRRRGSIGVARVASVLAALAVIAGVIVGPRLPGADAEEMISFRDGGDSTRVVVSPYVSLEASLVNQTSRQFFTVTADQPSYWRTAGLDSYDQNIWKVAANFSPEDGELPGEGTGAGQRVDVRQDFEVDGFDAIWLPAAFAPSEILESNTDITWNAETSSLTVANNVENSDGVAYSIVSSVPQFTSDELRAASEEVPPGIAEVYLALPELPSIVQSEAERITAGAPTRYDQMLALQNHFRAFDYSVELSPRVGDPIEQFLQEQVGFCQQFSGTFALMARSLGVPARVAIGFTWGDPIGQAEDGRTIFQVTGRQTHAWPEVWFDGLGWVAFEPTPGRGAPGAVEYTQVPARQDSLVQPDDPNGPITTTTAAPSAANPDAPVPEFPLEDVGGGVGTGSSDEGGGGPSLGTVLKVLGGLAVIGAYAGGIPALHWFRRRRRRQQVTSPAEDVETSWAEATETLELGYGLARRPSETRREFARRLVADSRIPRQPVSHLAEKVTVARFHPVGLTTDDAAHALAMAGEIETSVNSRVPAFTRWKRQVSPRRLLKLTADVSPLRTARTAPPELNGHHHSADLVST